MIYSVLNLSLFLVQHNYYSVLPLLPEHACVFAKITRQNESLLNGNGRYQYLHKSLLQVVGGFSEASISRRLCQLLGGEWNKHISTSTIFSIGFQNVHLLSMGELFCVQPCDQVLWSMRNKWIKAINILVLCAIVILMTFSIVCGHGTPTAPLFLKLQ